MTTPLIAWIGLGKMGAPMCDHLLSAGYSLRVFDVNKEVTESFADKGAQPSDSIESLVKGADIVVSMVPDDPVLLKVGEEVLEHLSPGKIFVDMSTVSPDASTTVADLAKARGVDYVCAPVSGSTELARKGLLTVFSSGAAEACALLDPIFATFAPTRYQVGSAQQARYMKLAINHMVGATAALMAEAMVLGRKGNIEWDVMLEVMGASVIASPLVKYKLEALKTRNFTPAFTAAQMRKDSGLVHSVGKATGAHMPIAGLVYQYFQDYAKYRPDNDFFGVVEEVESKSGITE
ncbi:NAD(P)-dependent oxidoreductase [Pseudomonas monteilii]